MLIGNCIRGPVGNFMPLTKWREGGSLGRPSSMVIISPGKDAANKLSLCSLLTEFYFDQEELEMSAGKVVIVHVSYNRIVAGPLLSIYK